MAEVTSEKLRELAGKIDILTKKIEDFKNISNELVIQISVLRKLERNYEYISSEWSGKKEAEISEELGQPGNGMYAERDGIVKKAEEGNSVILTYINQYIKEEQALQEELANELVELVNKNNKNSNQTQ